MTDDTITPSSSNTDRQTPAGFRVVELSREPIELYKILKFEGLASSGGEAKVAVASGQVLVNGMVETQKRKKIVSGDTIEFGDEKIFTKLALLESGEKPRVKKVKRKKSGDTNRREIPIRGKPIDR